ncbi:protein kinase [Duganella sp. FT94W]|uniref:Protein kinase n=1 Tax=Duganella lactea TaxID=2692173 RepID=A0ABW9V7W6_9BURK|nr:protein kinase [Duganella lactea]
MPHQIGKYQIAGLLGQGAMGVVYRATDPLIERTVALKTVRRDYGDAEQARELMARFRKEAQAAGRLMHPNIVAVHEYGESHDIAFIAMEFVDGTPLSALIGQRPCPLPRALAWFSDLLAALDYSHAHGVVHRDIKPANLLVTRDDRIKVSDFGIARIESSTLTQTGAMLGTPSYMSPEQFRGEAIDGRSDLFSAAIVLYQLLTGQRPFSGSAATVMQQVLNHTPQRPSQLIAALPPGLDAVIMRALAKAPEQRHATARAFQQALDGVLRDGGAAPAAVAAPPHTEQDADATILATPARTLGITGATGGTAGQPPWLRPLLPQLETALTHQVGPVAKLLLRRIALNAPDFDSLSRQLLEHIPSPSAQAVFQQQLAALGAGVADPAPAPEATVTTTLAAATPSAAEMTADRAPTATALTPQFATAVTPVLASAIGPIASIVVKRALSQASGLDDFIARLTTHIDAAAARQQFLEQAGLLSLQQLGE